MTKITIIRFYQNWFEREFRRI